MSNPLLRKVTTPYYVILPHDDIWHPRYLETFLAALSQNPDYGVAYGDLHTWGLELKHPWRHAVELPVTTNRRKQLFHFLLQGAEAMPWRGLTRSELLEKTNGFPVDEHRGFSVECEYAMSLILSGPVLHVPQTLYYKQIHHSGRVSASKARIVDRNSKELETAWLDYKIRMEKLLLNGLSEPDQSSDGQKIDDHLLHAALSIAALFRIPSMPLKSNLYINEVERVKKMLETLPNTGAMLEKLKAKFYFFLWQNAVASDDRMRAVSHLRQAIDCNCRDADVCFAIASEMEHAGSYLESLYWLEETNKLFPNRRGIVELRNKNNKQLKWGAGTDIKKINASNVKLLISKLIDKVKYN